jgi:hypothetical protein
MIGKGWGYEYTEMTKRCRCEGKGMCATGIWAF